MNHSSHFPHFNLRLLFFCLLFVNLFRPVLASAQAADYPPAESGIVLDINPGSADLTIKNYKQAGSLVYFTSGLDLWVTDGSAQGTRLLLHSTSEHPDYLLVAAAGNSLYFAMVSPGSTPSWLLYLTDGSPAGTLLLKDFGPVYNMSMFSKSVVLAGKLFFFMDHANLEEPSKPWDEFWVSGGTAGSTAMLATALAPTQFLTLVAGASRVFAISGYRTKVNGEVPFDISNTLWATEGTLSGTQALRTGFCRFDDGSPSTIGDTLFFAAAQTCHMQNTQDSPAEELWAANGVSGAAQKLYTFPWTKGSSTWVEDTILSFMPLNGKMLLIFQSVQCNQTGYTFVDSIWRSDGTAAGTQKFYQVQRAVMQSPPGFLLHFFTSAGNLLYLEGGPLSAGDFNWLGRTDGTTAGTYRVHTTLSSRVYFSPLISSAGSILFSENDPVSGFTLYRSDGGLNDAAPLLALTGSHYTYWPQMYIDSIYFGMTAGSGTPYELWRTDWTAGGTEKVTFADGGSVISTILGPTRHGLLLMRNDNGLPNGDHGNELWYYAYQMNNHQFLPAIFR